MIQLNKKQRRALRCMAKLPRGQKHQKVMEHRRRINCTMERYAATPRQMDPQPSWRLRWREYRW